MDQSPWPVDSIQESSDNYCLRWNDFKLNSTSNLKYRFRELRDDSEFYDVTLCCDNGTDLVPAHKKILASCSPIFRKILSHQKYNQQNTFLYLKGIHLKEVKAVLDFIYHGEVNISQDSINDFLAVGEELAIKGLADSKPGNGADTPEKKSMFQKQKGIFPPGTSSTFQASKKQKITQSSALSEDIDIKSIKAEPEASGSGARADGSSGIADGGFVDYLGQFGDGNEFDNSIYTARGSDFDYSAVGEDGRRHKKTFTIDFKLNAIREAERTNNRQAAKALGVDDSSIRHWRKNEERLIQSKEQGGQFCAKGSGRRVKDGLLEQILSEWHSQQISNGIKVSGTMLRRKAQEISIETGSESSKFSNGWLGNFCKRYGIKLPNSDKGSFKAHKEIELMERILYDWLLQQQLNNASVSGHVVRAKAEELCKACSPATEYNFSLGWLDGFKKRYNVRLNDRPADRVLPLNLAEAPQPSSSSTNPPDVKPQFPAFFFPPKL